MAAVSGPAPGPPATNLVRHWSASTPLLSAEGDEVVYTVNGTPTLGTVHGLDAVKFTGLDQTYEAAISVVPSSTDFTIYLLVSRTGALTDGYMGGIWDSIAGAFVTGYIATDTARAETGSTTPSDGTFPIDTATVIALEYTSATDKLRVGIAGSFGTALTPSTPSGGEYVKHHVGCHPSEGYTALDVWTMEQLIYTGLYDSDVNDYLLGLTS